MTGDLVVQRTAADRWRRADPWWSVLRVVLLLSWVAWAGLTWWSAPRETDAARATADLTADLAAHRVTAVQWGQAWDGDSGTWDWNDRPHLRSAGSDGPVLAWRTSDWRVHYTYPQGSAVAPADATADTDVQAIVLRRAVTAAGLSSGTVTGATPQFLITLTMVVIGGSVVILLLAGPAPVTGTRWFWWWLIAWAPLGLGVLWWLARERPWSRTAAPAVEPPSARPARVRRHRWYVALGISFLASVVVGLLTFWLHRLLGEALVPQHVG